MRAGAVGVDEFPEVTEPVPAAAPRRRWRDKFAEAFAGIKQGVRGQSSFFVHFFFAALVVAAGVVLECSLWQWVALVGCIGLVLTAELFNSCIETLFHGLDDATKGRLKGVLDVSAGAVLTASATAIVIGVLIFGQRLAVLLGWLPG